MTRRREEIKIAMQALSLSSAARRHLRDSRNQPRRATEPNAIATASSTNSSYRMPPAPQQYQVERIVGARRTKSSAVRSRKDSKPKEEFRVRWKGWPPASDTWEDGAQLRREVPHAVKFYEYLVRGLIIVHRVKIRNCLYPCLTLTGALHSSLSRSNFYSHQRRILELTDDRQRIPDRRAAGADCPHS